MTERILWKSNLMKFNHIPLHTSFYDFLEDSQNYQILVIFVLQKKSPIEIDQEIIDWQFKEIID